ncbi:MAG TPA: 50S ribosomal protein L32 [bacterium]|nr:50S ribosomal protein L32 [bacterium]HPL95700.1 50S ribosomal protein L32 [bacterium]
MGLPSKKHCSSQKRVRRGALRIKKTILSSCPNCQKPVKAHQACVYCGHYNKKLVLKIKIKKGKKKEEKEKQTKENKDKK